MSDTNKKVQNIISNIALNLNGLDSKDVSLILKKLTVVIKNMKTANNNEKLKNRFKLKD